MKLEFPSIPTFLTDIYHNPRIYEAQARLGNTIGNVLISATLFYVGIKAGLKFVQAANPARERMWATTSFLFVSLTAMHIYQSFMMQQPKVTFFYDVIADMSGMSTAIMEVCAPFTCTNYSLTFEGKLFIDV